LKANRSIAENDKTFEKRLSKTRTGSLLVHDDRTKLLRTEINIELKNGDNCPAYLVVSDQNHLLTPENKWNHTF
jgi:hypothetical protein